MDKTRTITAVHVIGPASLHLTWNDGTMADVDLSDFLRERAFAALHDPAEFARIEVGDWGHSLAWPSGAEIGADHGATRLFLEWRLRHALSLSKTADALGISRRMAAYYSSGEKRVPKAIQLACLGWEVDEGKRQAA
jgi:hypothetical protein